PTARRLRALAAGRVALRLRRVLVVLRHVVGDHVPRRFRADEDVRLRPRAGIVIEAGGGDDREIAARVDAWDRRAAGPAEDLHEVLRARNLVGHCELLAAEEPHAARGREEVRRVGGAARLPATAAVT